MQGNDSWLCQGKEDNMHLIKKSFRKRLDQHRCFSNTVHNTKSLEKRQSLFSSSKNSLINQLEIYKSLYEESQLLLMNALNEHDFLKSDLKDVKRTFEAESSFYRTKREASLHTIEENLTKVCWIVKTAFTQLDTADTIKQLSLFDPEGFNVYRAAKEVTKVNIYTEYDDLDNQGAFETLNGHELLPYLEEAYLNGDLVSEKARLYEQEVVKVAREMIRKDLQKASDLLKDETTVTTDDLIYCYKLFAAVHKFKNYSAYYLLDENNNN